MAYALGFGAGVMRRQPALFITRQLIWRVTGERTTKDLAPQLALFSRLSCDDVTVKRMVVNAPISRPRQG